MKYIESITHFYEIMQDAKHLSGFLVCRSNRLSVNISTYLEKKKYSRIYLSRIEKRSKKNMHTNLLSPFYEVYLVMCMSK